MAQTAGVMNGTDMAVYVSTTDGSEALVAHATECSISFSEDPRDITTKDSGGYRELLEGLRSFSISSSHLHAEDDTTNIDDLFTAWTSRVPVFVLFTTNNAGDKQWNCKCRVTSIEVNAGTEDNVTYSVSFEGTGAPVYEVIT
jgi:TP901-1 family phage major tail protein